MPARLKRILGAVVAGLVVLAIALLLAPRRPAVPLNDSLRTALLSSGIDMDKLNSREIAKIERLDLKDYKIDGLEGIEQFRGLKSLGLHDSRVASFAPLRELDELTRFDYWFAPLPEDFPEALPRSLITISVTGTNLTSLAFVNSFPHLECAVVSDTQVHDLSDVMSLNKAFAQESPPRQLTLGAVATPLAETMISSTDPVVMCMISMQQGDCAINAIVYNNITWGC